MLTVGHGTLEATAFADLLRAAGVARVVDVRRFPGSRRHPHFARDAMARWLPEAGLAYVWEEDLGGRRPLPPAGAGQDDVPASPHAGLRNAAFRGYAHHMATPGFRAALERVITGAAEAPTAILCAESLWWRCHRRLIADFAVLVRDVAVSHLGHDGRLAPHVPTDAARREGDGLVYDRGTDRVISAG